MEATLRDWALGYLKHRDIIAQEISEVVLDSEGYDFVLKKQSGDVFGLVPGWITDFNSIQGNLSGKKCVVVLFNTPKNVTAVANAWNMLKELQDLTLYFVNPDASGDQKWILRPFVHAKIAEEGHILPGLKALAEGVEEYR